jgi:valyl-tRNA synthetase
MGHAFQDTIMDTLIRYQRMTGKNTLWQVGTDHAGIATQMVVERQLEQEGSSRTELGRKAFEKKVWEWKKQSGDTISNQLKRLGTSTDWTKEKFTMDDELAEGVQEVFIKLYKEGLIYKGKRLVNWDPVLLTALSDLEVIQSEESSFLWHFKYPIKGTTDSITVATTRPETMLGDTAVAVNPKDKRYKDLIGKEIELPLTNRSIPIIADEYADQEFGSGCVKITPAHDFNDFEIGKRHGLEVINILTKEAKMNQSVPHEFIGLDRFVARKMIIEKIKSLGLLDKIEDYQLSVPRGDRSGAILEPLLTDQWFVKMKPLAEPAIKVVKDGELKFVPENWSKTYFDWMENIQDWCISRQLWWGHRIPAWYDNEGNVYVGKSEEAVRKEQQINPSIRLKQDDDVLDTWFSSALWPFSSLGWPNKTYDLDTFYPTNVLVTGFDIIFFWVARMIMMGIKFMGEIPFNEVYIHGLIRDKNGQKMSKSKGNILDPLDVIDGIDLKTLTEKRTQGLMQPEMAQRIIKETKKEFPNGIPEYGTDALRFTFAIQATTGRDIRLDLNRVEGYRNFCNKLWNAARFVKMNTNDFKYELETEKQTDSNIVDLWIQSKLSSLLPNTEKNFNEYRLDRASNGLYEFIWNDYCDWYLELSKSFLNDSNKTESQKSQMKNNLIQVLEISLRALHPIIPFITEEIWQSLSTKNNLKSIMTQPFPRNKNLESNKDSVAIIEWLKVFVTHVRQIRSEMSIPPKKKINILVKGSSKLDIKNLDQTMSYIKDLASIDEITIIKEKDDVPISAIALLGNIKIFIPLEGLIDIEEEKKRLNRKYEKILNEITSMNNRLSSEGFINKAPSDVVDELKIKYKNAEFDKKRMEEQIKMLSLS